MRIALVAVAVGGALLAADPNVGGPLSGFVMNAGAVRPVLGIPGSARLGDPVLSADSAAAVSSRGGLAMTCTSGEVRRVDLHQGTDQVVTTVSECPDAMAFSPTAESAVLVFRSDNTVRLLSKEELSGPIRVAGVAGCAVSDDAAMLVCSTDFGVMAVTRSGESHLLVPAVGAPAAFLPHSREAVLADGSRIYLLRSGSQLEPVADFEAASAVAVLGSETIAVASRHNRKIAAVHLQTRDVQSFDSPVQPEGLLQLSDGVVHVVSGASGPSWLMVSRGESASLVFVPAAGGQR